MKQPISPVLVLSAALLASGCSSIEGTTATKSSFAAEDYTAALEFDGRFQVTSINGRPEESRKLQQRMKLVPGTHVVEVIALGYRLRGVGAIPLSLVDGQVLKLTTQQDGASMVAELWDVTDQGNEPVKLGSYPLEITGASLTLGPDRPNNDTNGNRPIGR